MHLAPHLAEMFAQRHWDAVLVDHALGGGGGAADGDGHRTPRRIVLITPGERHRLPALKDAGFAGYLVKPVRAASLKAQLVAAPAFDGSSRCRSTLPPLRMPRPARRRPLNVLVAEDNEINALLTRALLTRLGHRRAWPRAAPRRIERWRAARDGRHALRSGA